MVTAEDVIRLASALRRRHGPAPDGATFTHVPVRAAPGEVLAQLRASSLGTVLLDEGALLNVPTDDWYVPVKPVRADSAALVEVGVTASTWGRLRRTAAELVLRLVYAAGDATASQDLRLYARRGETPSLTRWTYDRQRAGTGYEGDDRLECGPDPAHLRDMVTLVRRLTGEDAAGRRWRFR